MSAKTEPKHAEECVLFEVHQDFCREEKTIASGQNLGANKVVGKITSGGKFAVYNNGAGDGTEVAAGILLAAVDATSADKKGAVLVRGPAIVKNSMLDWGSSDGTAITAGIADLLALNILVQQ